jgi:putative RecB family exonuclease
VILPRLPRVLLHQEQPGPVPKTQYSHSRLSTFENCPRQFEYRYVQKIPRDRESIEAFLGKRVHEILERLYHHVGRHGRPPSLRQVLDRYMADWNLHWHEKVEIVRDDRDITFYRQQGQRCLESYYRGHYPFDEGETIGIEKRISFHLDAEGEYRVRGVIDRFVRTEPGHYEIHDYKTGGYMPPRERLERDRQLSLYQIGIQQTVPDAEEVALVWHYLSFGKTVRVTRTPEDLETLRYGTIDLIDRVEGATEFKTSPGPLCRWCEYSDICPDARINRAPDEEPVPLAAYREVRSGSKSSEPAEAVASEPPTDSKQLTLL